MCVSRVVGSDGVEIFAVVGEAVGLAGLIGLGGSVEGRRGVTGLVVLLEFAAEVEREVVVDEALPSGNDEMVNDNVGNGRGSPSEVVACTVLVTVTV